MAFNLRQMGRQLAIAPWVWPLIERRRRGQATVFVWHRFTDSEADAAPALDALLGELRRRRISIRSLGELLGDPGILKHEAPVVFTIDDGYADFGTVAAPIFERHGSRATVFLTSGFLDGTTWMWWDRIHHALRSTARTGTVRIGTDPPIAVDVDDRSTATAERFAEAIEFFSREERETAINELAAQLGVDIPARPTSTFAPMTWDTVRDLESRGFEFGPHTIEHPILSTVPTEEQLLHEINGSWQRLQDELSTPLPVFCLPNGSPRAFGQRERRVLARSALQCAVSTVPGYAGPDDLTGPGRYDLPRFPGYFDWRQSMVTVYGYRQLQRHLRQPT